MQNLISRPVVALIVLAACVSAQTSSSIRGTVSDPSASVVPNVSIAISGAGFALNVRTDQQGRYVLNEVPAGTYRVSATAPGFADWAQDVYEVRPGQTQTLDIALTLRAQADQVTVAAAGAAALDPDPSNNAGAIVLTQTDLDALPDDSDDLTADLQALAGPAAGPGGSQFFIDGFTGGRMPPKQSIREIRVNQNPFAAQFDRPGQGRVEIFTKPGTDEFHGDFLFQFSDAMFNSRNPFNAVKPPYQRRQWEAEFSGALGKKTSFSGDFERRDINENAFVNAVTLDSANNITPLRQALVTPLTGTEADLKLDRQLSPNHTLTLRYGFARDTNDNAGVGGFSLPSRAYQVNGTEQYAQFVETGVLNPHTVNEVRFRFRKADSDQHGGVTSATTNVMDAFTSGGSPVGVSFDRQNRYEAQNFTSIIAGRHTVRVGGLMRAVTLENQAEQNYAGTFTFTSLESYRQTQLGTPGAGPSQFTLSAGNPLASLSQFDFGVYAQDDFRIRPGLMLSGGLRYEAQTNAHDRGDIAPRVAIAWAPGKSKSGAVTNVIRAGAGFFYDRLSESLTLDALRQNGVRQQQFLIPFPAFYPNIPSVASLASGAQPQTVRETDASWQAPRMLQMSIGYERQLPWHMTVSTNYLHTAGIHSLRSRNINAPLAGGVRPFGGVNSIYLYETSGVYRQNQLTTNVNARISAKMSLSGYYVYGRAMSNTDGAASFPSNQYDLTGEYGRAGFDIRHRLQFNGSVTTKWNLRFSPFLTVTSGRPYNITTGTDLNGDGLFTDRPSFALNPAAAGVRVTKYGALDATPRPGEMVIPRNFAEGPGFVGANLRVSKIFNLGEHAAGKDSQRQLVFSVNARNLLNHPNFAAPTGNLSSALFGQSAALTSGGGGGGSASANRKFDLQARFTF